MNLKGQIYDISIPLTEKTPVYPGDPAIEIEEIRSIENGDGFNLSSLSLTTHSGTHLDAPLHFIPGGRAIDEVPLETLITRVRVIEIKDSQVITPEELKENVFDVSKIIFKTANSQLWEEPGNRTFNSGFVYLSEKGAGYLLEKGIELIGIDYLTIEGEESEGRVHSLLLGNDVLLLEGLDLRGVSPGLYTLVVLPLKITAGNGAPARAVLISDEIING